MVILCELWAYALHSERPLVCQITARHSRTNHRKTSPLENMIWAIYALIVHKFSGPPWNCMFIYRTRFWSCAALGRIYHRPTYLWCFQHRFTSTFIYCLHCKPLESSLSSCFFAELRHGFYPFCVHTLWALARLQDNEPLFVPINTTQDCRLLLAFNRCSADSPKCLPIWTVFSSAHFSFAFDSHKLPNAYAVLRCFCAPYRIYCIAFG